MTACSAAVCCAGSVLTVVLSACDRAVFFCSAGGWDTFCAVGGVSALVTAGCSSVPAPALPYSQKKPTRDCPRRFNNMLSVFIFSRMPRGSSSRSSGECPFFSPPLPKHQTHHSGLKENHSQRSIRAYIRNALPENCFSPNSEV